MENSVESDEQQDQGSGQEEFGHESSSADEDEDWEEPQRKVKAKVTQTYKISNSEGLAQDALPFILSDQQISEK